MTKLIKNRLHWVIITIAICIIAIFLSLYWNSLLSKIINSISVGSPIQADTLVRAVAAIILSAAVGLSQSLLSGWTCELMTHDLRINYARKILDLPLSDIENINAGEYVSKLQNEIADVSSYLNNHLFPFIDDCIRFTATLIWLLLLNPKLTLLSNFPILLILWYVSFSSKVIQNAAQQSQKKISHMNGLLDSLISIFPIIRIFEASTLLVNKYNAEVKTWEELTKKEERIRAALMSLSAVISFTPLVLLFLFGGHQVINGEISLGNFYIFINLSGNLSGVMNNMPNRIAAFRRFMANMKRLETIKLT